MGDHTHTQATTLTLKQTHSLSVSLFPHSNYDKNTLGICGTSWLSVSSGFEIGQKSRPGFKIT